jgi:hypothetical protein
MSNNTTTSVTIINQIAASPIYSPACMTTVFVFFLPFVLAIAVPEKKKKALATKSVPAKSVSVKSGSIKSTTTKPVKYNRMYIVVLYVMLYLSLLIYLVTTVGIVIFNPKFWLFKVPMNDLFKVFGAIIAILFDIAYVWSIMILPGWFRIYEGIGVPNAVFIYFILYFFPSFLRKDHMEKFGILYVYLVHV